MSAVIVRTKGKRGTTTLETPRFDRDFTAIFGSPRLADDGGVSSSPAPAANYAISTPKPKPQRREQHSVDDLLARLHRALEQQAAATNRTNRTTIKNRAGKLRKRLRALGVENPPDRSGTA